MLLEQISHNEDIKRLIEEKYSVEIKDQYIFIHKIPYVTDKREIKRGTLLCPLDMSGDKTIKPATHVIHFIGEYPCKHNGTPIEAIRHQSGPINLGHDIIADFSFSNKPPGGYKDYYEKLKRYSDIMSSYAMAINPDVSATEHGSVIFQEDSPFVYGDTNSSRAEIGALSQKLEGYKIAIIGLGGTGAYLLDFLAKTPVGSIHLYDGDYFFQHNAFRAPGASNKEVFKKEISKVNYFANIYSNMKKNVIAHDTYVDRANASEIEDVDFAFLCIDAGEDKSEIVKQLLLRGTPFIDCGIGIELQGGELSGSVRITAVIDNCDHFFKRVSLAGNQDDGYATNIQIAELNALNAVMAVMKWKQILGFYKDANMNLNSIYDISEGDMINED